MCHFIIIIIIIFTNWCSFLVEGLFVNQGRKKHIYQNPAYGRHQLSRCVWIGTELVKMKLYGYSFEVLKLRS